MNINAAQNYSYKIRHIILERSYQAHVGHIGSALSVADIIAALYSNVLNIDSPNNPNRDRFVLSKGHAALALYAVFHLKGWISREVLETYCQDNTLLGVHPEQGLPGVDFATGSLGMGTSYATGAALAAKMQKSARRVFVLVSDAECNEGIVWEAAMFGAHHKLSNLYIIIDLNNQQALGYTKDVLDLTPLSQKWQAFGWDVHEIDGHNHAEIISAIHKCGENKNQPHAIVASTKFGKGVSYMEDQIKWHYWPMSEAEFRKAMQEIEP